MHTLPQIAKAARFDYDNAKRWAQRYPEWFEELAGHDPETSTPDNPFATRRFGLEATKAILVAMSCAKIGAPPSQYLGLGVKVAFLGDSAPLNGQHTMITRVPGALFPESEGRTYALISPKTDARSVVPGTSETLGARVVDFCGDNDIEGCMVIDITAALRGGLGRLGEATDSLDRPAGYEVG